MAQAEEDRFNVEVLKLLLQVAWSDGRVDPTEGRLILGLGRSWYVPEMELSFLERHLQGGQPLPPPNLQLLRSRRDDVMEAARALADTDGHVDLEEDAMIRQIQELLG